MKGICENSFSPKINVSEDIFEHRNMYFGFFLDELKSLDFEVAAVQLYKTPMTISSVQSKREMTCQSQMRAMKLLDKGKSN